MSEEEKEINENEDQAAATEAESSPAAEVEKSLEEKCRDYEQGWKRALADYENLKKDMFARNEDAKRVIKAKLASELLPVVDNFAQAVKFQPNLDNLPEDFKKQISPWLQGVLYIEKQFTEALSGMGVEAIPTDGSFDPHLHEAAGERHEEGRAEGEILEVLIPGWKINDLVLRPAKLIIQK
jgi:molecular chaperone GrpE